MQGFGQILREHRKARGLSQQALAVALGMSAAAVTQWEREVIIPRRETAQRIDDELEARGEILSALGYSGAPSIGDELTQLRERVAVLEAEQKAMAERIRALAERVLLPDADEVQHPDESRTAQ